MHLPASPLLNRALACIALAASILTPAGAADGVTRVPVVFSGGHGTLPVDHGRPVKLIAAALDVKPEVFRAAFSGVHPAGPGKGPTEPEARGNKKVLMDALGKFGVTNERLDTVSNFYRYPPGPGGLWKTTPATANALVKNGSVVGFEITSGGAGYTTAPKVTVPNFKIPAVNVDLSFTKDLATNGAVTAIALPLAKK